MNICKNYVGVYAVICPGNRPKKVSLSDRLFEFAVENEVSMHEIKIAADIAINKSVIVNMLSRYGLMNYDRLAECILDIISSLQLKYRQYRPSAGSIIDGFMNSLRLWENNHGLGEKELENVILSMDAEHVRIYRPNDDEKSECTFDFTYALSAAYVHHCRNYSKYGGMR